MNKLEKAPLVSVFMATYNQEKLVVEAIESVLAQDFDDWELVIGDDCSTDNTNVILESYREKYSKKIKVIRNPVNLGITGNCNVILKNCIGKYIAFLDGDDIFLPGKLSKQIALMELNPDCVMSYHDVDVFGDCVSPKINSKKKVNNGLSSDSKLMAKKVVKYGGTFGNFAQSAMIRNAMSAQLKFDTRVPIASDWLFWIDYLMKNSGTVLFINEVLAKYRVHDKNTTNKIKSGDFFGGDTFVTLGIIDYKYCDLILYTEKCRALFYSVQSYSRLSINDFKGARTYLLHSIRIDPFVTRNYKAWLNTWRKQILQFYS